MSVWLAIFRDNMNESGAFSTSALYDDLLLEHHFPATCPLFLEFPKHSINYWYLPWIYFQWIVHTYCPCTFYSTMPLIFPVKMLHLTFLHINLLRLSSTPIYLYHAVMYQHNLKLSHFASSTYLEIVACTNLSHWSRF